MLPAPSSSRISTRLLVGAALVGLAALSASALAASQGSTNPHRTQPEGDVIRVRRGGSGQSGGTRTVSATRSGRAGAQSATGLSAPTATSAGPDGTGDGPQAIPDLDPLGAGLPDATRGEGPALPAPGEVFIFEDIGVRGEREGRIVKLIGAEVVFANRAVQVKGGTPLGHTGVMGTAGPNPGSVPSIRFTLDSGGPVTLAIQPLPGNRGTPVRPIRTVTIQIP